MGGDQFSTYRSLIEDESSIDQDFSEVENDSFGTSREGVLHHKVDHGLVNGAVDLGFDEFGDTVRHNSSTSLAFEVNRRRDHTIYADVLATYDDLQPRSESLTEAKNTILSYTPGSWIDKVDGFKSDYIYSVPQTTSLLLIGPKGSGKSSLVNKISRFFEHNKFAPERAQVSNGSSVGQGTFFLQEYMIPRGSHSFCLYDTRGLSDDSIENKKMIKRWLTRGVRHGELSRRASDDASLISLLKSKVPKDGHISNVVRAVNFVIVVVNGISVLESLDSDDEGKKQYTQMIATIFNYPFLSFRDDMPVIVVTHGDLLTLTDRVRIRVYLGNLLGIPPKTQIFDIPENNSKATELAIVDLLSHCLDRADRNLPLKKPKRSQFMSKTNMLPLLACILLLGIGYFSTSMQGSFIHHSPLHPAPSDVNKPPDPTLSGMNKHAPSDVNSPPDHAPSGVDKRAPLNVNRPPDPTLPGKNNHAPSDVNSPPDHAPSGVDKRAPLDVNRPPDPTLSGMNKHAPSDVNSPLDHAPSGVDKRAPFDVNRPPDPAPTVVKTPALIGVNKNAPSGVNRPPDPTSSGVNKRAPSSVKKHAPSGVKKPAPSDVGINWYEIRHLWLDEA